MICLSPISDHFVQTMAARLGVSKSEFIRRVLDNTLVDYAKSNLYELPPEFTACPIPPLPKTAPHRLANAKNGTSNAKSARQKTLPDSANDS